MAPAGRFFSTRLNLGRFGASGGRDNLTRGVGNYFKSGYGGGGTAARRFGGTARSAGALLGALSGGAGAARTPEHDALEAAVQAGVGTEQIINVLIEAISPVDGTQDAEANRKALADSLSELVTQNPNADFLNLTPEQLNHLMALFVANDVFMRFSLDVGKAILEHAPSIPTGLSRIKEAKDYIREVVIAQFNKHLAAGTPPTKARMVSIVSSALRDAIEVFEGYAS
ncbi:MAG: Qat anti-phage system associated protein QatB [Pirellulales bacterium]|nr:Qat anti-phage system associated protein QatB [Pirellulales bacterium]